MQQWEQESNEKEKDREGESQSHIKTSKSLIFIYKCFGFVNLAEANTLIL